MNHLSFSCVRLARLLTRIALLLSVPIAGMAAPGGGAATGTGAVGVAAAAASGAGGAGAGRGGGGASGATVGSLSGSHGVGGGITSQSFGGGIRNVSPGFSGGALSAGQHVGNANGSFQAVSPGQFGNIHAGRSADFGRAAGVHPVFPSTVSPQPANAWTEPRANRTAPAARAGRYGYNGVYDAGQSYLQNRLTAGQHLNPGAYDFQSLNNSRDPAQRGGYRHNPGGRNHRRSYSPYFFNGLYYPYFYGGSYPGYYGGYYDDSLGSSLSVSGNNWTDPVAGDVPLENRRGYWDRNDADQPGEPADEARAPLPDPPAQVGPENPAATGSHRSAEAGPDSLVEAVQSELARRGYFAGRVDATYGESTKEALRRFQADRQLAVTGRVNEATLHALQLD